jgi:TRAP-type uncharacterized transport system substrate-binding protein
MCKENLDRAYKVLRTLISFTPEPIHSILFKDVVSIIPSVSDLDHPEEVASKKAKFAKNLYDLFRKTHQALLMVGVFEEAIQK